MLEYGIEVGVLLVGFLSIRSVVKRMASEIAKVKQDIVGIQQNLDAQVVTKADLVTTRSRVNAALKRAERLERKIDGQVFRPRTMTREDLEELRRRKKHNG